MTLFPVPVFFFTTEKYFRVSNLVFSVQCCFVLCYIVLEGIHLCLNLSFCVLHLTSAVFSICWTLWQFLWEVRSSSCDFCVCGNFIVWMYRSGRMRNRECDLGLSKEKYICFF